MLTVTQKRYIDICIEQIANNSKTNQELADQFGVARTLVDRAIRWGRENELFAAHTTDKLRNHLLELRTTLGKLERAFLAMEQRYHRLLREAKNHRAKPPDAAGEDPAQPILPASAYRDAESGARAAIRVMALLSERILGYRTRIMELEGIYKQVLNLQHTGAGGGPMRILYEAVQPDPQPGQN